MSFNRSDARRLAVAVLVTVAAGYLFTQVWVVSAYLGYRGFDAGLFAGFYMLILLFVVFLGWHSFVAKPGGWRRYT